MPKKILKKKVASRPRHRKADFGYFIIGVITVILIAIGIFALKQNHPDFDDMMKPDTSVKTPQSMVFMGKLPCADCEGINTVVTLNSDNSYTMKMTYIGKDTSFTENGLWEEKTGIPSNPQAKYYYLTPSTGNSKTAYEIVDGMHIKQLDADLNPIDSSLNFTLTKQLAE